MLFNSGRRRLLLVRRFSVSREVMEYDVLVVGGGPAGLSAAIRLKQQAERQKKEISVCLIEKGSQIGSHILSGNVLNPTGLNMLFPDWKEKGAPVDTPVKEDKMFFLTKKMAIPLPVPPTLHNYGNYVVSLSKLCRWLGEQATNLGVEVYPGFAAKEVIYGEKGEVLGIITSDMGISKDGKEKGTFQPGMELRAKQTLLAEGARGSLSELVMKKYNLRKDCDPQTYGIGLKEVWELDPSQAQPGRVWHSLGWPGDFSTWMGSFMYHMNPNILHIGMVVGLDYKNPYLNPYLEFQRFKHHPKVAAMLKGAKPVAYGARVINEGGFQSIPKLTFPGGALLGCSAGFLNVPKIKGTHNAMLSGIYAADAVFDNAVKEQEGWAALEGKEMTNYADKVKKSSIWSELKAARNVHPSYKWGLPAFLVNSGLESLIFKGRVPWTLRNTVEDVNKTDPASKHKPIDYPKPDGVISFDLLTNLQRSGTGHEPDQPSHLTFRPDVPKEAIIESYNKYGAPETRFCPAKVYEFVKDENDQPKLVINASNCVHCKTCDIKTPSNYIKWTVPEGGGGPNYDVL